MSEPTKDINMTEVKSASENSFVNSNVKELGEFDDLSIDPVKEAKLVRKLDRFILPMFCVIYFLSFLDRSNIGNAKIVGLDDQLGLTQSQYSTAVSVFYATYICVEIPGVLLVKRLGPHRYITIALVCWSLVTIFTCFVRSYGTLVLTRLLLGLFEGSVFPSQSLYITMTYKRQEQAKRLGWLYVCSCASGAFGGLIATGITKIKPRGDFLSWSWLYVIEGCISLCAGVWVWFGLPDDPTKAKFLTEEEKHMMSIRAEQQRRYMGNQKFDKKEVIKAFIDPKVAISCLMQFSVDLVLYGFSTFLPSILKLQLGYDTMAAQYLSVPVYAVAAISVGSVSFISDRYNIKWPLILGLNTLGMIGYIILLTSKKGGVNYFATYLIAFPLYGSVGLSITWLNNNMAPHYRRATALGCNQTIGNLAGVVAGQIYRKSPYKLGNSFSLGCSVMGMICSVVMVKYLHYENSSKQKIMDGDKVDKKVERTGSDALDFKYVY